ncbi:MAG: hypothetical protein ABSH16_05505 [Sedimentisphaerales bacterium]
MNIKNLPLFLLTIVLAGCGNFDLNIKIPVSLHPLYTDKEITFDQRLLGNWKMGDSNSIVRFENPCENSYEIFLTEQGHTIMAFDAHLLKLDNKLYLDISPAILDANSDKPPNPLFLPTHMLMKIKAIDPNLQVQLFFPKELEKDPNLLKNETISSFIVLTASTKELQNFIKSHTDDEALFGEPLVLERLMSDKTPDCNNTDSNRP